MTMPQFAEKLLLSTLVVIFGSIFERECLPIVGRGNSSLKLVHVIFRHGERTTYQFYPNDPHKNETFYPIGLGGLTNRGKMGEYELGKFLRDNYGDFLGDVYTEDVIYTRSTDVTRTKMSAELVLAGLWPPSEIQNWNDELRWQPAIVNFKTADEEDLMHPHKNCEYKKFVTDILPKIAEVKEKFIAPNQKLFDFIAEHSGMEIKSLGDVLDFYFILKTEEDMNLTLPEWIREIYPEPVYSVAAKNYEYYNYDPRVRKINAGYLLQKIVNDSYAKIDNHTPFRKMFLYSGHETTLGYMMQALGVLMKPHVPPYSSALIFEIHETDGGHFIKLRYRDDESLKEPKDLRIPDCDEPCFLEKFVHLYEELLPTTDIKTTCTLDGGSVEPPPKENF